MLLFLRCCALIVALALAALAADSTGERSAHLQNGLRAVLFVGLPAALALVVATTALLRPRALAALVINGTAIGVALLSGEIWLSLHNGAVPAAISGAALGLEPACGQAFPPSGSLVPLGGISNHRITVPWSWGGTSEFLTDPYGFNNPPGQWQNGATLALGDSFTWGWDVPAGAGLVDQVRRRLGGPLVNLGCGGNGPLRELGGLLEYGPLIRPKLVLWVYFEGNDLQGNLPQEIADPVLARYLNEDGFTQGLSAGNADKDAALVELVRRRQSAPTPTAPLAAAAGLEWRRVLVLNALRERLGIQLNYPQTALDTFGRILAKAKATTESWGGRLVLVVIPDEKRYLGLPAAMDAGFYYRRLVRSVDGLGIPVIDGAQPLERAGSPRRFYRGHFTEEGYRLVGDWVADNLPAR